MIIFFRKYVNIDNFEANRKYYKQTFLLFSSRIFDLGIGFATNMFIAKHLQQEQFGIYSFVLNFLLLISLFFDFGFFTSISRILALNTDEQSKNERISFYIKRLFSLMLLMVLFVFIFSFVVDSIFKLNVGSTLRILALFSGSTLIATFFANITAGTNEVRKFFFYNILWRSVYTIILFILYFNLHFTVLNILGSLFACQLIFFLLIHRKQIFVNDNNLFNSELKRNIKEYGFDIYISRIIDTASFKTDSMLITYFHSASSLSPYSIAQSFGSPVGILGNTVATIFFKNFANESKISNKIIIKNFLACFFFAIVCYLFGFLCFKYYLKYNYSAYPQLLLFMISVSLLEATFAPFNMWFVAKGFHKDIRIKTYSTAIVNILLNFILIYNFAEIGAGIASLISVILSLIIYYFLYKKAIR